MLQPLDYGLAVGAAQPHPFVIASRRVRATRSNGFRTRLMILVVEVMLSPVPLLQRPVACSLKPQVVRIGRRKGCAAARVCQEKITGEADGCGAHKGPNFS